MKLEFTKIIFDISVNTTKSPYLLRQLISSLQFGKDSISDEVFQNKFDQLIQFLKSHPKLCIGLRNYLQNLFSHKSFIRAITELGISSGDELFTQLRHILSNKILPEVYDIDDANRILSQIFISKNDYFWLSSIKLSQWSEFLCLLELKEIYQLPSESPLLIQFLNSIQVISLKINTLGVSNDIIEKFPQLEKFESPFMAQQREISSYIDFYLSGKIDRTTSCTHFKQIMVLLDQCLDYVSEIRKRRSQFGVTLKMTGQLLQLRQNINRLKSLLFLITVHDEDIYFKEEINLLTYLVRGLLLKTDFRRCLTQHLELLTYQVTEHAGETGEQYITTNWREYLKMFYAACGGGIIVGILSALKLIYSILGYPLFGTAFMYSMNYSAGFILIYLTGSKLATKQPAMTATYLANAIDTSKNIDQNVEEISIKTIQIFRSQFVAFVGNVLLALPVAMLIAVVFYFVFGSHLASIDRANYLVLELDPFNSYALFHAAIAGFYLYISGLISGYYENLAKVTKLSERILHHPNLNKYFSKRFLIRTSHYVNHHIGPIMSNFFLGIFLGTTSVVGVILGLPLDIRHITFSAANFGLAIVGLEGAMSIETYFISFFGIICIGFLNFIVSFSLAMLTAMKSRSISSEQLLPVFQKVFLQFLKKPHHFFIPQAKKPEISTSV